MFESIWASIYLYTITQLNKVKTLLSTLVLISFLSISSISQAFNQNSYDELEFNISWVSAPQYRIDTLSIDALIVIRENWDLHIDEKNHPVWKYALSRDKYPNHYIHSDSTLNLIDQFLNSTQSDLLENDKYELISSSETILNNYFGKEYTWKDKDANEFFKNRVYLVESTIYQLSVYSRLGESNNKAIDEFLSSFVLSETLRGKYTTNTKNYDQSYSINFPQTPELVTQVIDSEIGKLTMQMNMIESENDPLNHLYMASEIKYPTNSVNTDSNNEYNKFLMNSIYGSVNAVNGELISVLDVEYADKPGKEFKISISDGKLILKYRVFYINDVLYSLGVMTDAKEDENNSMNSFLNSFKIE